MTTYDDVDYDPEVVNIRPAATVMLVDDRPDLQVFMMERNAATIFAGGMWVFPGGAVEHEDHPELLGDITMGRTAADTSKLMAIPSGGIAYYVTAIREAFEEAGILLAHAPGEDQLMALDEGEVAERFWEHRRALNAHETTFVDIVRNEQLSLDLMHMHYIARWITPLGPPRRFDARFFIARMPESQTPIHDDDELVHSSWLRPAEILEKVDREEMVLMSPTLRMGKSLAQFARSDDVIESAAANLPDERARVTPDKTLLLPGDDGYEGADQTIENGWVRLRPMPHHQIVAV